MNNASHYKIYAYFHNNCGKPIKVGKLNEPYAKRINKELFEIRVKHNGQWRTVYSYITENSIIILSAFAKKTQKTPIKEINKASKRLIDYK